MEFIFTLLTNEKSIIFPDDWLGWISWTIQFVVIVYLAWQLRRHNKPVNRQFRLIFTLLLLAVPITSLFLGLAIPTAGTLTPQNFPLDTLGSTVMVLSAVPWLLAAGLLGPTPAVFLALFSGLLRAVYGTNNLFTPLEYAWLTLLFSFLVYQRYRTPFFRILAQPLVATLSLTLLYPIIYCIDQILVSRGTLPSRLDYAWTHIGEATLMIGIELLVAGLFSQVVAVMLPTAWSGQKPLEQSPAERNIQARVLYRLAPLALLLFLLLITGTWYFAGKAANAMLRVRMTSSAEMAAQNIPYFLGSGQKIINQLAEEFQAESFESKQVSITIEDRFRHFPFFRQLYLVDKTGSLIAGYPKKTYTLTQAPADEQLGFQYATAGVPGQIFAIAPDIGDTTAQVTFITPVLSPSGDVQAVLMGHTDFASNPFTQPLLSGLQSFNSAGGTGILLDEYDQILVHPDPSMIMGQYTGLTGEEPIFYHDTGPNGARRVVYFLPAVGYPWSIALMVPAELFQKLTLEIAVPLLGIIMLISIISIGVVYYTLGPVTSSLKKLSNEALLISQGKLDESVASGGDDEIGALRNSIERMRLSLKTRVDEQNRLLEVSQGVSASLEISDAIQPILDSALAAGASVARVLLVPAKMPGLGQHPSKPICFSAGPTDGQYATLDEQILAFTRQQDKLVLGNLHRPRLFNLPLNSPAPASLMAIALRHENSYYGAFWIAYEQPHRFTNEEVRFLVTLGNQATLAAVNSRLYQSSEIGRQRLAAILDANPDPILVTDQHNRLLLANPAAWTLLDLGSDTDIGQPIENVIAQRELVDLLRNTSEENQTVEILMAGKQVYMATTTPIQAEGQRVGRVCILRDVTRFKELDTLKSEFVSTVSHDLRSPLSLIRGYTTMLEMVGQLNEQQVGYVQKILSNVEVMSRLVTNLLDPNRIGAGIGLKLEQVSVIDVIEPVVTALTVQAAQKHIQISTNLPANSPGIEADPALLQQALYNLVDNAIKFNRNNGTVAISAQVRSDRIVFEVKDSGIGISPMDQARLFDKYYNSPQPEWRESRSAGLGLAIVKSIAERHNGQVWVESQLGKGSTFFLAIPLQQTKAEPKKKLAFH